VPRVIGIDPGTVSIDLCGLDDGQLFLDRSFPTAVALADPAAFVALLEQAGPLDLVAGPSGYGLPLTRVQDATDEDLRLAFLAAPGESGGIGGLAALLRGLARSTSRRDGSRARSPRSLWCCSSWAAPSPPPWRWPAAASWTVWGARAARWGSAPPAHSTGKWPISRVTCPRRCCSVAGRRPSRGGARRLRPPSGWPIPRRRESASPARRSSRAP